MQRNYSIDILKFICAILVVFLHSKYSYESVVRPLTRCAVPCFFMISGFLLYKKEGIGKDRIFRNIRHILLITMWATLLYIIWKEIVMIRQGGFLPSSRDFLKWIFLNDCPFAGHLWYLYAYIYVLLIVSLIDKLRLWKYLFMLAPLLLIIELSFGEYSLIIFNRTFPVNYVRNFLFVGFPYFAIGAFFKNNPTYCFMNNKVLWGGVILFSLTSLLEKYILIQIDKVPIREHYFSSTFLAISLFMLLLSFNINKPNVFSRLGEKDSLYIYIIHPIIITIIGVVFNSIGLTALYSWIAPFLVVIVVMYLIYVLRKCRLIH